MKKALLGLIVLLVGILPFLPIPVADTPNTWSLFLGRFHILLLHFPIVLVLLLIALEVIDGLRPKTIWQKGLPWIWGIALTSCCVTAVAGYLLYTSGEYQGDLIRDHLWGGVLLTISLAVATYFRWFAPTQLHRQQRLLAAIFLGLSGGLVLYTSHLGGSVTHGSDFLTEYAPSLAAAQPTEAEQKPKAELLVFDDLIMPALERRCLSCHNEHKTKGDLLMISFTTLSAGGKSAKPILVPGQPEASELYHRIQLPPDDEDHMPPPEKPALEADEIALIRWWITEGADPDMQLGEQPTGSEVAMLIDRYLPTLFRYQRDERQKAQELAALQEELEVLAQELHLTIRPDLDYPGYFAVALGMPPTIVDDRTVNQLLPYAEVFSKIALPGAEITDDGLYDLGKMTQLRQLYLPKTCIKGAGLVYLKDLTELKTLNLSNSLLNNAGALQLLQFPQLEQIYVFGTSVDENVLEAMRKNLPNTQIIEAEGVYY